MKSSPKYIMFTDYDGTITQQDSTYTCMQGQRIND